jgi:hypothetical protein
LASSAVQAQSDQSTAQAAQAASAENTDLPGRVTAAVTQGHGNEQPHMANGAQRAHVQRLPGFQEGDAARHLVRPEHADTELAGVMHDLMHATHQRLMATKDGPLPGALEAERGQGKAVREAALRRLQSKPYAVQQHVELLEAARKHLERLVSGAAISATDYMALHGIMLDLRVSLLEDHVEVARDQLSTAYRNLESVFSYLKKLQVRTSRCAWLGGFLNVHTGLHDRLSWQLAIT